uniref:Isochorismatase-like domain-containing protein n=1 Tax=Chenopodium quinoa TaxID=63459 RepID=A0A803LNH9_CHEQI
MAEKWKKTALLVIDMQNDFVLPGAPLLVDGAAAIVPNVIKAVEVARERGMLVVWRKGYMNNGDIVIDLEFVEKIVREHDALGRDVELFRRHLYSDKGGPTVKGHEGAELVEGLEIHKGDYKLVKTRMSGFFATNLHSFLLTSGIDSLVFVGIQTPNCIRQTVFDAVALDFPSVSVIVDATAAKTPEVHYVAVQFSGQNFIRWSRSVKRALVAKNKDGFITGSLKEPDVSHSDHQRWKRADYMVVSWILSSMSAELADDFAYIDSASELWSELQERFGQSNGPLVYQLKKEIDALNKKI